LANELGIGLFHQIFHTRLNLWWCVKTSALYADRWAEIIRIASVLTRTLRRNVRHSHFLAEGMTTRDLPAWSRQRSLFHRNRLNQHLLQTFDDVYGKMCAHCVLSYIISVQ
jgi:hypothetical protein